MASQTEQSRSWIGLIVRLAVGAFVLIVGVSAILSTIITVGAGEIVVIQALSGKLNVYTQPGWETTFFGKVTRYPKSAQFWFSEKNDEGKDNKGAGADESIKVRFNDGGHAQVSGSLRYDLPLDYANVVKLHMHYGSPEAVDHELIKQAVTKAVYMTGPLMSSSESGAERRPDIISYIDDQVLHGVYRTTTKQVDAIDPLTGAKKQATVVEIQQDPGSPNNLARQERSPVEDFGIRTYNVTLNSIAYDPTVEAQIAEKQKAIMAVQTAQAEAKKAEQNVITVEMQGKAAAASAKWEQEKVKATEVTKGEQQRDVAALDEEAAKHEKAAAILRAEGSSKAAKLALEANGNLDTKLDAWVKVNTAFADSMGKQPQVPQVMMGGGSGGGQSAMGITEAVQLMTAKQLGLDLNLARGGAKP